MLLDWERLLGKKIAQQSLNSASYYYRVMEKHTADDVNFEEDLQELLHITTEADEILKEWDFCPFYNRIRCSILYKIEQIAKENNTVKIGRQAAIVLSRRFTRNFVWLSLRCLIFELHECKSRSRLKGSTSKEEYQCYLREYLEHTEYQAVIYAKYPVLARLVVYKINRYVSFFENLLDKLDKDKHALEIYLCNGNTFHQVLDIQTGLSDEHQAGVSVTRIALDNGYVLYYKPRSGQQDIAYHAVCEWICKKCGLENYERKILNRGDHAWEAEVDALGCENESDLEHYYMRLGIHLALSYIFSIPDDTCRNVGKGRKMCFILLCGKAMPLPWHGWECLMPEERWAAEAIAKGPMAGAIFGSYSPDTRRTMAFWIHDRFNGNRIWLLAAFWGSIARYTIVKNIG